MQHPVDESKIIYVENLCDIIKDDMFSFRLNKSEGAVYNLVRRLSIVNSGGEKSNHANYLNYLSIKDSC